MGHPFWYSALRWFHLVKKIILRRSKPQLLVVGNTPSSTKDILSFGLLRADNTSFYQGDEKVSITGDSIKILVPGTAVLNALVPQIQINGVKVSPASSITQDFSKPVVYTVTAQDSSKKSYMVVIKQDILKNLVYIGSGDKSFYHLIHATEVWYGTQRLVAALIIRTRFWIKALFKPEIRMRICMPWMQHTAP